MVRGYDQNTDHEMNMGPDRFSYGTQGMPMNTQARTRGGLVQADVALTEKRTRSEIEHLAKTLQEVLKS